MQGRAALLLQPGPGPGSGHCKGNSRLEEGRAWAWLGGAEGRRAHPGGRWSDRGVSQSMSPLQNEAQSTATECMCGKGRAHPNIQCCEPALPLGDQGPALSILPADPVTGCSVALDSDLGVSTSWCVYTGSALLLAFAQLSSNIMHPEKREPSSIAGRIRRWCSRCGKQCGGSSQMKQNFHVTQQPHFWGHTLKS